MCYRNSSIFNAHSSQFVLKLMAILERIITTHYLSLVTIKIGNSSMAIKQNLMRSFLNLIFCSFIQWLMTITFFDRLKIVSSSTWIRGKSAVGSFVRRPKPIDKLLTGFQPFLHLDFSSGGKQSP